jgi:hypothetical protein
MVLAAKAAFEAHRANMKDEALGAFVARPGMNPVEVPMGTHLAETDSIAHEFSHR